MLSLQFVPPAIFRVAISMPLLTELVRIEDLGYKHGAPKGALASMVR